MADNAPTPNPDLDVGGPPERQAGFGKFLRDVLIVVALGGGLVYWYFGHTQTQEAIVERLGQARTKMNRHDLASLKEAQTLYQEILDLDSGDESALSSMARVLFYQSEHGLDTISEAQTYLSKAQAAGAENVSRYAAEGYLMAATGQPQQAADQIRSWINDGKAAPPVAHALAVALLDSGNYQEANRIARQAREADFSNIAIRMTMAESNHHAGSEKEAIKDLSGVVRNNLNPEHMLAKAWLAALRAKNYGSLTKPVNLLNEVKEANQDELGPRTKAFITWAEGELSLALGNADGAIEKADAAIGQIAEYGPFHDLKARALLAQGKAPEAVSAYEKAISTEPVFRGFKWDLARLKSQMNDDSALALVEELEKSDTSKYKGPDYLVFKAEHALRKGNLEEAMELYKQAAEEGDSADILFGIAKVTFEEEKKKDKKADLERVGAAFQETLDKKKRYPEVHEYLAGISMWNFLVDGAHGELLQAEKQYKALKKPIPEIVGFYNRAIDTFTNAESKLRREASKYAQEWERKKADYLQSLQNS